jgi:hypothetical protein
VIASWVLIVVVLVLKNLLELSMINCSGKEYVKENMSLNCIVLLLLVKKNVFVMEV